MERIASFTINHLNLMPGLYVSRRDAKGDCVTTTFDLRITAPNREPVIDTPALHTIEHLAATYLRNCESKEDVIYFGPMGCRTGCYLVMICRLAVFRRLPSSTLSPKCRPLGWCWYSGMQSLSSCRRRR